MERGALGTRFKEKTISLLVAFVLAATGLCVMPFAAYAEAGDLPDHSKTLTVNNDGTYTLALNVKGDSEKQVQKVNVIVIVDKSYSMSRDTGTGAYVASNTNGPNMYGYVDGEYVLLTRQGNRPGNYTYWYNGT